MGALSGGRGANAFIISTQYALIDHRAGGHTPAASIGGADTFDGVLLILAVASGSC